MSKTVTINQDKLLMLKETVASNEFVSHIPFLYHATPSCYVDSIKEFGLGGKIPEKRFWPYKGTPYENIKYGVFLATDEYVAESYLEVSEEFEELCEKYEEDLEIVVFRINTNDLDLSLLSEDENQTQEGDESERTYFYNGIIPFEKLEKITLYENVIKEAAPEADEYEIGDEGSNPLVGGNGYHINESANFDSSEIGAVNYSEDFKNWFGNSILKDENGQPLKMYHGTNAVFDAFSKEYIGSTGAFEGYGFNFTPFESRARGYNSINVIEAYLKVENPMTTKSHKITLNKLIKIISELDKGKPFTDTIVAAYEPTRYNEKWDAMYYRRALPIAAKIIYNYNKENNYGDAGLYAEICLCGQSDKIETINTFERLGYDSAIFYDNNDKINTVIVFEPNQIKRTSNKTFSIDSDLMNEQMTNENFDFEVNSSDIDLSSFKKKHELVPNIWKPDGKLDSRIRLKLLDIADDFWKYVNLTWVEPSGIILTGSICNFNWSQYSDIDLHLIVDFDEIDEKTEFVRDYLDAKKNEWNSEHSGLQIMGYQVELYVQNLGEMPESNGIYDLEENDWIKEPNPDDIKSIGLNKFSIKDKAAKIMTIIDDMYDTLASTDDSHKIEQMGDDASYLWKKVKEMRKSSLEKNGESGSGNIVYKILRREFYLDKLWRLKVLCYDKLNSIK